MTKLTLKQLEDACAKARHYGAHDDTTVAVCSNGSGCCHNISVSYLAGYSLWINDDNSIRLPNEIEL